ncbi:MAG: 4Fe-4S dicluster domain-containing protein [Syntrophales bacterium]|jgi:ferredoxin|nr:4Fe-4S dicluster domain-containing protein [Syntrophales bacterium]
MAARTESGEKLSRRELLQGAWAKPGVFPAIDGEKCTGCGLCAVNCQEQALTIVQSDEEDAYRIIFAPKRCTACRECETACPEQCLTLLKAAEEARKEEEIVVFEDGMTRCGDCGVLMFPAAMVRHLQAKTRAAGTIDIPFDLCPECRIQRQVTQGTLH